VSSDGLVTRIDHVVIGVRDLAGAMERYRQAGFQVDEGGRHTGRGTRNALIRFGLDYLELITVDDELEALATGGNSAALARRLKQEEEVLAGFALATTDIEALAARFQEGGLEATGPASMARLRPDGRVLSWRLLIPLGTSWFTPWPFFIQWDDPDDVRMTVERPRTHPNGVIGVARVRIGLSDLDRAAAIYGDVFGLAGAGEHDARGRTFRLGQFGIDLIAPRTSTGPTAPLSAARQAEGVFEVTLAAPAPPPAGLFDRLGVRIAIERR
jgi:catechol 2,3-dioxygenase-like lactoylglutathione lyase family enzyme